MPSTPDLLGEQLHEVIKTIFERSRRDLPRAIRMAETYLAWVRRFKASNDFQEEQRVGAIETLRRLIALLKAKLPRKR
jgi:hypothetical protein